MNGIGIYENKHRMQIAVEHIKSSPQAQFPRVKKKNNNKNFWLRIFFVRGGGRAGGGGAVWGSKTKRFVFFFLLFSKFQSVHQQ